MIQNKSIKGKHIKNWTWSYEKGSAMWQNLPFLIFPKNVHSVVDLFKPYTFEEQYSSPISPPTTTHAKLVAAGSSTHEAFSGPLLHGSSGPCIHFWSLKLNISVDFIWALPSLPPDPPTIMMLLVEPSSNWMVQLEWKALASSNDGPLVQLSVLLS